jgi:Cof subfamily protein (haloacid dehalogenase superfamily)
MELAGREAGFGYRAMLIDIDGTLLNEKDEITPRTLEALNRVRARGIKVFLATGRSIHGAEKVHAELDLDTPLVCYNGMVIYEPSTGEWLRHRKIPDDLIKQLLQVALRKSAFFFVFHGDKKYSLPYANKVHAKMAQTLRNVEEVELRYLPRTEVTKVNLYCKPAGVEEVRGFLNNWSEHLQVDTFPLSAIPAFRKLDLMYLDVQPVHDGKAQALDFLQEEYGIPPSAVIAFGDQVNDRPMIQRAGLGVSMGNAPDSLKRDAVLVIDTHRKEGVARFLDLMFP